MEMVQKKMEMTSFLRNLNEVEKIKSLFFDEDQYFLFEMIPKPFIVDLSYFRKQKEMSDLKNQKIQKRKKYRHRGERTEEILVTNKAFWKKEDDIENMTKNFVKSLKNIKDKKEGNFIDEVLLETMHNFNYF